MRNISTKTHGYIEYVLAIVLWFAPTLFNFENVGGPAVWVPRLVAIVVVALSLATDFELGVVKAIPMRTHLVMDYIASIFLAASPFLLGFNTFEARVWMPHVFAGLLYLAVAAMTEKEPAYHTRAGHAHV